jgi:hypothetical protein
MLYFGSTIAWKHKLESRRPDDWCDSPALDAETLTKLQPGFARLMPEIGARYWKAYYAAQARNWELASWQIREMRKLFTLGTITRPKYRDDVEEFLREEIDPLMAALADCNLDAFNRHYSEATDSANEWHRRWNKGFILWKLPDTPPPDLELGPAAKEANP